MPWEYTLGQIRRPSDLVEDVAVVLSARLWDCGRDGSLWVHPRAVINILPEYGNVNIIIQTPNGKVDSITVYRSGRLLEVHNCWLNSGSV